MPNYDFRANNGTRTQYYTDVPHNPNSGLQPAEIPKIKPPGVDFAEPPRGLNLKELPPPTSDVGANASRASEFTAKPPPSQPLPDLGSLGKGAAATGAESAATAGLSLRAPLVIGSFLMGLYIGNKIYQDAANPDSWILPIADKLQGIPQPQSSVKSNGGTTIQVGEYPFLGGQVHAAYRVSVKGAYTGNYEQQNEILGIHYGAGEAYVVGPIQGIEFRTVVDGNRTVWQYRAVQQSGTTEWSVISGDFADPDLTQNAGTGAYWYDAVPSDSPGIKLTHNVTVAKLIRVDGKTQTEDVTEGGNPEPTQDTIIETPHIVVDYNFGHTITETTFSSSNFSNPTPKAREKTENPIAPSTTINSPYVPPYYEPVTTIDPDVTPQPTPQPTPEPTPTPTINPIPVPNTTFEPVPQTTPSTSSSSLSSSSTSTTTTQQGYSDLKDIVKTPLLTLPKLEDSLKNPTDTKGKPKIEPKPETTEDPKKVGYQPSEGGNDCCVSLGQGIRDIKDKQNTLLDKADALGQAIDLSLLEVINAKLGNQLPGGLSGALTKAWQFARIDKVLNALNTILLLHNAAMLSQNIGSSLGIIVSQGLSIIGIKDENGDALDINGLLGGAIQDFIKSIIGEKVYNATSEAWKKLNAVYTAGINVLDTTTNMLSNLTDGLEVIGRYNAKIGNALKASGTVFENSYEWMDDNINIHFGRMGKIDKLIQGLESIQNVTSDVEQVTQDVVDFQDQIKDLKDAKDEFNKTLEDNLKEKTDKEDKSKEVSQGATINSESLISPNLP